MSMVRYIIRRFIALLPILFGVLTLTFILSRAMPGDPVKMLLPQQWTQEMYQAKLRELGLDRPIWEQFFRYVGDLFVGNWGVSVSVNRGQPVWDLVWERLPRTIDLSILSIIIASIVGIKSGVISAAHRNKPKDTLVRGFALVGVSIPIFWMGLILQYFLAYGTGLFPAIGFKNAAYPNPPEITGFRAIDSILSGQFYLFVDYILHLVLPVACLSFVFLAGITRQTRSSMLEILELDYIRTARAKGVKEKDVINTHALKNALIPTVTVIGLGFAGLLAGAVLTETTFALHGVGDLLFSAIVNHDYWILNAVVFITTLMFIIINLITDLIYGIIDPRIRY